MKDYKDRISSHVQFDDPRWWEFVRDSKLPRGSFDQRWSPEQIVFAVCMVLLALGLLAVNITP